MKALFYVGSPLGWAKGGYTIQIFESKRALEKLGVLVTWLHHEDTEIPPADIIHYWGRPPNDFHWQLAQKQGLKIVISELHQSAVLRPRWIWPLRRWMAWCLCHCIGRNLYGMFGADIYQFCDAAIAVTPYEMYYMQVVFNAPVGKTHYIPNGVDDIFFDQTIGPEPFDGLLYIGYICERKNSVAVAEAATKAQVPVKFIGASPFAENDPYVTYFKTLVDGKFVTWAGEVTDRTRMAAMIRGAHGVVIASQNEAVGLCVLEGFACSKPAMVSNLPNLRVYFEDAVDYCHQPQHPAFARELQEFYRCVVQAGMKQEFPVVTWDDVGRQIFDVYKQVLKLD